MPPAASLIRVLASRRMLVALLMGFSCGLPLLLTLSVLQAWMKEAGVDLGLIGLMALARLPYSTKFLWSPLVDRLTLPLLTRLLGRRRAWLLFAQLAIGAGLFFLAGVDPAAATGAFAAIAVGVAISSATIRPVAATVTPFQSPSPSASSNRASLSQTSPAT